KRPSATLFHRLQAPDHGFDPGPYLLVLLQQVRALRRERVLSLFQGAVFVLELVANLDQGVHSLLKSLEFMLKLDMCIFGHGVNIEPGTKRINCHNTVSPAAWPGRSFHGIIHGTSQAARPAFPSKLE